MSKKILAALAASLVLLSACSGSMSKEVITISNEPLFNPDYSELVSRSDLNYEGIIDFGPYGMPVANGRFGGPVWQKDAKTLSMQLNHTDTFMYNDASANSTYDNGALGRLDIDFGGEIFGDNTSQRLSLYDAKLSIASKDVSVEVIADTASDAVLVQINDSRAEPQDIKITLSMLRNPEVKRGLFSATSWLTLENDNSLIALEQLFEEECTTGIEVNNFYCRTAVAVRVDGSEYTASAEITSATITVPAHRGVFTVIIGGESSMDDMIDVKQIAANNALGSPGFESVYKANQEWWSDFWHKSYVYLPEHQDFEQRRTYYMYLAGISNRGSFPSKYNGGLWIAEGDRRDWGSWYWNWNQDSLYQPLESANHGELLDPLFEMRERCYEQYKVAAQQLWGIESEDAIFIGETSGILGAETLPDDVAKDMQKFLAGEIALNDTISQMGDIRNSFLVPWNYKFWGGSSVSYVTHTMVATQETAEYFWQRYLYTGDEAWLREHAYKFIKGAAELYRNYYGFVKEDDGCYHFNRTNLHEHIWGGRDVIDDLSLARGIFAVAVKSSEILGIDEDMRGIWQECLDNLAPYPMSSDEDAIGFSVDNKSGKRTWAQGRQPATLVRALEGTESPQFKMLEKFDVLNMETRDQKLDNGDFEIAVNTFYDTPGYLNQYKNGLPDLNGSSRFLEDAAKLGMADELEVMFASQYKMFRNTPNLLHDQGDYYSAEGYGTWSQALQQALMQCLAPLPGEKTVIRVFPAWPKAWDAKFKLLAKGGFLVSSSITGGVAEYVEIESQLGGECLIRNPWDSKVDVYRNGVKSETLKGKENSLLSFETEPGDRIVLVPKGVDPDQFVFSLAEAF